MRPRRPSWRAGLERSSTSRRSSASPRNFLLAPYTPFRNSGASKSFVTAFSQSLQHELAPKGLRIQAVLPAATATDFWELAGRHVSQLPQDMVMSAENLVDAALAGLDQGETVTIPVLQDGGAWDRYEAARRDMFSQLSGTTPSPRYRLAEAQVQANVA